MVGLRTSKVVVLVGPPGTGKGTLINWLATAVAADPAAFGFAAHVGAKWPDPLKRTPDDSWSAFELVGGLVPDGQSLRWTAGAVLQALAEDRWLVLDELNRADLDKIFGPLLTWLAEERVTVGAVHTDPTFASGQVILDWDDSRTESTVAPTTGLKTDVGDVVYAAGKDWRLLGTYNPKDADRVFSMGQALGRRMSQIPVPAMAPDRFESYLPVRVPACPQPGLITAVYAEHHKHPVAQLGPALFIDLARYVADAVNRAGADLNEALAEGFVLSFGHFVTGYPDDLLAALLSSASYQAAFAGEVTWLKQQLSSLR